jgi:hypothetical protein
MADRRGPTLASRVVLATVGVALVAVGVAALASVSLVRTSAEAQPARRSRATPTC